MPKRSRDGVGDNLPGTQMKLNAFIFKKSHLFQVIIGRDVLFVLYTCLIYCVDM